MTKRNPLGFFMGNWKFRKPEPKDIQGTCVKCNKNKQKKRARGFDALCSPCQNRMYQLKPISFYSDKSKRPYRKFLKSFCEECGFIPEHECQLDVDHKDGNKENNLETNLQTLCANCHRLKTYKNKDWKKDPR